MQRNVANEIERAHANPISIKLLEIEETSEEIAADSPIDLDDDQATVSVAEPCLFRKYSRKDVCGLRISWNQHSPLPVEDSTFNKSRNSLHSSEIGLEDDQVLPDLEVSSTYGGETVATISSENSNEDYSDCIVEDSQESSGIIIHDDI
ncbi:hypothetical protein V6N11_021020 [Hibiscus sabdariffa]|uniref:Uncharacterized protein n=1 Tax=Hibiscus sabdariffa TaxID=183260 RepID=A0ABR1Z912_9ROSI